MEGFGTENHQPGQCIPSQEGWGRPHPSLFCFPAKRELLGFVLVTVFILCNQLQAQSVYSLFSPGSLTDYSDSLVVCFRFAAEHGFVTTPSTTLQPEPGGRICTGAPSHLWCWSFATAFIDAAWMREKFDTSVLEKRSSSSRIAFHNRPWETAWSFGTESGLSAISSIWTSSSLYYRSLAGAEHRTRLPTCPLSFLEMGGVHEPGLVCARLPPRVPKPKPHPLQVRFHRSG